MSSSFAFRKYFPLICLLSLGMATGSALADWSDNTSQTYSNKSFGDYPPANIDQQIQKQMDDIKTRKKKEAALNNNTSTTENTSNTYSTPAYPAQGYQQQTYGAYAPAPAYQPRSTNPWNTSGATFNGPWNNRGSSFSMPWGNNNSGFSGPWNNNGSSFSMPWSNNNSGFSGPWNNNGSSFSMPWGNNNSGFSPWGNRYGR